MHGDAAHNLPADLPLAGGGQLQAVPESVVPVHQVGADGGDARPLEIGRHGLPDIGVLDDIAVGGNQNFQALRPVQLLLLPHQALILGLLRLFGGLVGLPHGSGGAAQRLAQGLERGRLILFLQYVQVVGEKFLPGLPEDVLHQIRQGLKAGTHVSVPPEAADPRHQDIVALAAQRLHMAQVDFQRQARLINGAG